MIPAEAVEELAHMLVSDTGRPYRMAVLAAESIMAAGYRKPEPKRAETLAAGGELSISDEAVEAALAAWADRRAVWPRDVARKILEAAAPHMLAEVTALVAALTDPEDCQFDHHGGCQAHGYLDLQIGEMCPQLEAKAWAHNHRPAE